MQRALSGTGSGTGYGDVVQLTTPKSDPSTHQADNRPTGGWQAGIKPCWGRSRG